MSVSLLLLCDVKIDINYYKFLTVLLEYMSRREDANYFPVIHVHVQSTCTCLYMYMWLLCHHHTYTTTIIIELHNIIMILRVMVVMLKALNFSEVRIMKRNITF